MRHRVVDTRIEHRVVDRDTIAPAMEQELDVAVGATQRGRHRVDRDQAPRVQVVAHLAQHGTVHVGIAHDTSLPDARAPRFELRFDQQHEVGVGATAPHERRRHRTQRDERHVGGDDVDGPTDTRRVEVAHVRALEQRHPRIVTESPRELATRHVDRDHLGGVRLEEAVGETAGGRAGVEGAPPGGEAIPTPAPPYVANDVGELAPQLITAFS